jgi:hypothetical protein
MNFFIVAKPNPVFETSGECFEIIDSNSERVSCVSLTSGLSYTLPSNAITYYIEKKDIVQYSKEKEIVKDKEDKSSKQSQYREYWEDLHRDLVEKLRKNLPGI